MYDGNEAVASVAYRLAEVIAIYPITPASPMGEYADSWAAVGRKNLFGQVPKVVELQSEGGAAGALHGAVQAGSLVTTFTASQGLLLMIPNLYKMAGELSPAVFHIAARALATQALSIFGDHSDVMAARATGWALLFGSSVQEAQDLAAIAHAATLHSRLPFLNIMDGFRTSHEINQIEVLEDEVLRKLIPPELIQAHRARALSPDHPVLRGSSQNPDTYFQSREAANPYYLNAPAVVQEVMDQFAALTGRSYHLFDYSGHPQAERVAVAMGSGAETLSQTAQHLAQAGERVGVITVRLFRPFAVSALLATLPKTVRKVAVLDRCKEPGSVGEPLYQEVVAALAESEIPAKVIGGRYGLASKEFPPAMAKAVFTEMAKENPKTHFTVGITDDVTHLSLDYDPNFTLPIPGVQAVFYGLGSDGTVSANKSSVQIIGEETQNFAQGYFVYDSKKSGSRTASHLRFGPQPIRAPYLVEQADFVGVHQFGFLDRYPVLEVVKPGAVLLLNAPYPPEQVWPNLPREVQETILAKNLTLYAIDAYRLARELGLGTRINTLMQAAFFAVSGVLPEAEAISAIKNHIRKAYGKRGEPVVRQNFAAVDAALLNLYRIEIPEQAESSRHRAETVSEFAPDFVQEVLAPMLRDQGDTLPVSALPPDGTFPTATAQWEKRDIAQEVPLWESDLCIQCGKCVLVCPHAVIRAKTVAPQDLAEAPAGFAHVPAKFFKELPAQEYTIQVSTKDCTGCGICVETCPAHDKSNASRKAINMRPKSDAPDTWEYFLSLPEGSPLEPHSVKNVQFLTPLFEFSGACAGCGETPYLKLLSQLFGERALIANATGCSSIYGGNLPTTPWSQNRAGRGPAWSNSLFEDNAEFGLGMRLSLNQQRQQAQSLLAEHAQEIGFELINPNYQQIEDLKARLSAIDLPWAQELKAAADTLMEKSVWIVGGDGWAYDIGFGGLDHVLASGANVNILVLDTEVYSNTGGQASKATPMGAVAKFAATGKRTPKKDLAKIAMDYQNVYVAQVAMGASDTQCLHAFLEAESYPGTSLIIAYSHCIAHGIDMQKGMQQQKRATDSAYWPLFRYDPRRREKGENPLVLDSKPAKIPLRDYILAENRYQLLRLTQPEEAEAVFNEAQQEVERRYQELARLAGEAPNA